MRPADGWTRSGVGQEGEEGGGVGRQGKLCADFAEGPGGGRDGGIDNANLPRNPGVDRTPTAHIWQVKSSAAAPPGHPPRNPHRACPSYLPLLLLHPPFRRHWCPVLRRSGLSPAACHLRPRRPPVLSRRPSPPPGHPPRNPHRACPSYLPLLLLHPPVRRHWCPVVRRSGLSPAACHLRPRRPPCRPPRPPLPSAWPPSAQASRTELALPTYPASFSILLSDATPCPAFRGCTHSLRPSPAPPPRRHAAAPPCSLRLGGLRANRTACGLLLCSFAHVLLHPLVRRHTEPRRLGCPSSIAIHLRPLPRRRTPPPRSRRPYAAARRALPRWRPAPFCAPPHPTAAR